MKRVLLLALAVGFALSTIETPVALAQDDGAALLEQRCTVCQILILPVKRRNQNGIKLVAVISQAPV